MITSQKCLVTLICFSLVHYDEGARILGIFPSFGYSQYILGSSLMRHLVLRGHEVTVVSPYKLKEPLENYTEIVTEMDKDIHSSSGLYGLHSLGALKNIELFRSDLSRVITISLLKSPQVQKLLRSNTTFDVVLCEIFTNEAHVGFAHYFKAPLVLFSSLGANEWSNHLVANPAPFAHFPNMFTNYGDIMNFWQRLSNSVASLYEFLYKYLICYRMQDEILKKYFPNAPDLDDLLYNASIILLNSNSAITMPVPHVPSMIEIGGFHISPKKLPENLQKFLDDAADGAIFFSMGSNLRSTDLSNKTRDAILKTFSKLKQRVLWKWEDENLAGKPDNVLIGKWFPQPDILVHPNIRAFITHGGLLSVTEAIYSGVPLIGIPVFGDQAQNVEVATSRGFGIHLPLQEITEGKLTRALKEILTNPSYTKEAQRRSALLKDQPVKPLDLAAFWVEYVIRHGGATHLHSTALRLRWYQYLLLDVAIAILLGFVCFVLLTRLICYTLIQKFRKTRKEKDQ